MDIHAFDRLAKEFALCRKRHLAGQLDESYIEKQMDTSGKLLFEVISSQTITIWMFMNACVLYIA
jgi:hypothetical protein